MATPFHFQHEPNYLVGLESLDTIDEHYLFNMDTNSIITSIADYQTPFPSASGDQSEQPYVCLHSRI